MGRGMILASDLSKSGTWSKEAKLSQAPWASGRPCLAGAHWQPCSSLGRDQAVCGTVDSVLLGLSCGSPCLAFSLVPQAQIVFLEAERSLRSGVWLSCGLWYPRSQLPLRQCPALRSGEINTGCLLTRLRRKMVLLERHHLAGPQGPVARPLLGKGPLGDTEAAGPGGSICGSGGPHFHCELPAAASPNCSL